AHSPRVLPLLISSCVVAVECRPEQGRLFGGLLCGIPRVPVGEPVECHLGPEPSACQRADPSEPAQVVLPGARLVAQVLLRSCEPQVIRIAAEGVVADVVDLALGGNRAPPELPGDPVDEELLAVQADLPVLAAVLCSGPDQALAPGDELCFEPLPEGGPAAFRAGPPCACRRHQLMKSGR